MDASQVGPGDVIADRQIVTLLGSGGEGDVWEARRPDGSRCALKLVRPEVLPNPDEVRRRGAWLVRIDHPAMVRVSRGGRFTSGDMVGWGFVEMDLVEGPSLQAVGPIPDALDRLAPIAEALDMLHAGAWSDGVPLIHRDVKPGNLIAAPSGLVLVDPSTMRGLDTRDLTRVGTPAYVAPEVHGGRFGPLADVYSLAATAAALLTGARGGALLYILREPWNHDLPESVCSALEVEPADRPSTCAAVVRAVAPVVDPGRLGTMPIQGQGVPFPQSASSRRQIGGPGWALPLLALISLVPAIVWAVRQTQPTLVTAGVVQAALIGAGAAHLAVHLVTRRATLGLLAPPWAWSELLSGRQAFGDRRATWLADVVAGTILLTVAGVVLAIQSGTALAVPGGVLLGLVVIATAGRLAHVESRTAWSLTWLLSVVPRVLGGLPRLLVSGGR